MTTRILIADDHRLLREGIRSLIADQPTMTIVGEASDGRTAVQLSQSLSPDIVIMDVSMPGLNGIEATRQIRKTMPGVKVIALSMNMQKKIILDMLGAGASGYLLKDCFFEEVVTAIHAVASGGMYLSPQITDLVLQDYLLLLKAGAGVSERPPLLTAKEREVLQLLAEGKKTKDIAATLQVSVKNVEYHRQQIMSKLDIHTIAGLTKYAIEEGILSLTDRPFDPPSSQ